MKMIMFYKGAVRLCAWNATQKHCVVCAACGATAWKENGLCKRLRGFEMIPILIWMMEHFRTYTKFRDTQLMLIWQKMLCNVCSLRAIHTFLAFVAFVAVGANVDCDPTHQPATHSGITNPRRLFVETHLCCRLRVRVRDRLARNLGRSGGLRLSQPLFQKVHQVQVSRPTNVTAPPDLWPYEGKFHKRGAERNLETDNFIWMFKSTCFNQELYRWWSGTYHSHHCVNCNPVEQHYLLPSP